MPAWTAPGGGDDFLGTKIVNVFPGNGARGLPAVLGLYALQSGVTGAPLATIDGTRLTLVAHRRRLGARRALSRARRRQAPADRRRRRARALPRARPREPTADRDDRGLEPSPAGRRAARRRLRREGFGARGGAASRRRGAPSRHRSPARRCRRRRWSPAPGSSPASISISSAPSTCACAKPTTRR